MACLAELGHDIMGIDINPDKVKLVNSGKSPVLEPGLEELLAKHVEEGKIMATLDSEETVLNSDLCLVCVGTPSTVQGAIDSTHLVNVVTRITRTRAAHRKVCPILVRSTALPPIHRQLIQIMEDRLGGSQPVAYVVHPEFLREGVAVNDFFDPPKIIFGCTDDVAEDACRKLYPSMDASRTFYTDPMTAAMVKYADNCFHALKVTFANEIGIVAKSMGIDSRQVMDLFCQDTKLNISPAYLRPGYAFGGSCLPKDLRAITNWSRRNMISIPMLEQVMSSNDQQIIMVLNKILAEEVRTVGLFGLAFKDGTDDLRESPMVTLAEYLHGKGKDLLIYDSALSIDALFGSNLSYALQSLPHLFKVLVKEPVVVVANSDLVIVARNFKEIDWEKLPWREDQVIFDLLGTNKLEGISAKTEGLYW
jgi:GDP-mannose 6-dehydrogenase